MWICICFSSSHIIRLWQFSDFRLTDRDWKSLNIRNFHFDLNYELGKRGERRQQVWGGITINSAGWRFTRGNIYHLSLRRVVGRPFIIKRTSDQSVLSSMTEIPRPPAGIIAQVTCQIQPLTLMTAGKAWNKDLVAGGSKSRELLCSPSYLDSYRATQWIPQGVSHGTKHSGDSF